MKQELAKQQKQQFDWKGALQGQEHNAHVCKAPFQSNCCLGVFEKPPRIHIFKLKPEKPPTMKQELATQEKQQFDWKGALQAQEHNAHTLRYMSREWETSPVGQSLAELGIKRVQSVAVWMTARKLDNWKTKFSQHLEKDQWSKALDLYIETRDFVAANAGMLRDTERKCIYRETGPCLSKFLNDIPV